MKVLDSMMDNLDTWRIGECARAAVNQPPERCGPYCDLPEGHEGPHDHSAFPTEGSPA